MIRSFVAIEVCPEVRARLTEVARALGVFDAAIRTVAAESSHLTLKFLGNIEEEAVPGLKLVLESAAQKARPFVLRFQGLDAFPNLHAPRVFWVGVDGTLELLQALREEVEGGCARLGFPRESRPFKPHLTMARVCGKKNLKALCDYIRINGPNTIMGSCEVRDLHLYQSQLRPEGSFHRKLASCQLGHGIGNNFHIHRES